MKNVRRRARDERVVHGRLRRHVDGGGGSYGRNCTLRETRARVHAANRCRIGTGITAVLVRRTQWGGGATAVFTVRGPRKPGENRAPDGRVKGREKIVGTYFLRVVVVGRQEDGGSARGTVTAGAHGYGNTGAPDGQSPCRTRRVKVSRLSRYRRLAREHGYITGQCESVCRVFRREPNYACLRLGEKNTCKLDAADVQRQIWKCSKGEEKKKVV